MHRTLKDKKIVNAEIGLSKAEQLEFYCKINDTKARSLLKSLNKKNFKNTKEQGDSLENVVNYFLRQSGIFSHVRPDFKSTVHQIDHHALLKDHVQRIFFQLFKDGRSLVLGESKNYSKHKKPLGVDIVYKVEGIKSRVGYSLGIYFTRGGVTGNEFAASVKLINDFCTANKNVSVLFDDADWKFLEKNPKLFQRLLFSKIEHFVVNDNFKINYNHVSDWGN